MSYRIVFSVLGSFFLITGGFLLVIAIMDGSAPLTHTYNMLSMAVMAFSLSYLYPQFVQKNERIMMIRQKGMFFSFIAFLIYSFIFTTLLEFNVVDLTASDAINILIALMISTLFSSWVFFARRY